ncbi:MAG: tetratricopeptide repeat protein [Acidobacteria bacterium]|nr:tetratricopeptide repeat protein [Acidobacteriota bacterium]
MLYCLDDGSALLDGPASGNESATAILHDTAPPSEAATKAQIHLTQPATVAEAASPSRSLFKWILSIGVIVVLGLGGYFGYRSYFASGQQISSIAVMPFVNEGGDPGVEYLSDGMTETLISSLSKVPDLDVKPRSSVFRYKGKETDPQTAGKELNVQAVLNGRVTQRGEDLSLYVELIDVTRNKTIWSDTYYRKRSDLVNLQADLARDVSRKLESKLSRSDEAKVTKAYTTDPEAYQLYLKGNYYRTKYTEEGYKKAIECYQQAIEIDPGYALAYNGIAKAYNTASEWYLSPSEAEPKAKAFALKAVALDPSIPDPHISLSGIALWYEWDWVGSEREARRVSELDPSRPAPLSFYYAAIGRLEDNLRSAEAERNLQPLDLQANANLAVAYYWLLRYDDALKQARATIDLDPNYWNGLEYAGLSLAAKQQYPEAIAMLEKACTVDNNPELVGYLGYVYGIAGKRAEAEKAIDKLKQLATQRYVSPYYFALIYSGLNDKDRAFESLNKAYEARSGNMVQLNVELAFEGLRTDARFKDLLKRVGLPDWR